MTPTPSADSPQVGQGSRPVILVPLPNSRFGRPAGIAEAGVAGEFEREELLVDPDAAAFGAVAVLAETEVEAAVAVQTYRGVGFVCGPAADVAGFRHSGLIVDDDRGARETWPDVRP